MARENQGLQIALIVFVMLSILLGVGAFLSYRQYQEVTLAANEQKREAKKANDLAQERLNEVNELKRMLGAAETEKLDKISEQFNKDVKSWGEQLKKENLLNYRAVCQGMAAVLKEKAKEGADRTVEVQTLKDKYEAREGAMKGQIEEHQKERRKSEEDYAAEREKVKASLARTTKEQGDVQQKLEATQKEGTTALAASEKQVKAVTEEKKKLDKDVRDLTRANARLKSDIPESFAGEISWVNQQTRTAWINLGRADGLTRLALFSVYPGESTDLKKAKKKAGIEVTQILGEHLAEARIVDDNMNDPVIRGDKIQTPVWNPGERRHFALAGFMDLDGDGRSDTRAVHNLIVSNGGVIDAEIDDKGKRVGEITSNTRYVVLGAPPDTKGGGSAQLTAFNALLGQADRLGIERIPLNELLNRMGWKRQTKVVQFGPGANPAAFRSAPDGSPQKSTGATSEIFQPRQPPRAPGRSAF